MNILKLILSRDTDKKFRLIQEIITKKIPNRDLSDADLSGADLSNAYLKGANLKGASLSNAILSNAIVEETSSFRKRYTNKLNNRSLTPPVIQPASNRYYHVYNNGLYRGCYKFSFYNLKRRDYVFLNENGSNVYIIVDEILDYTFEYYS